MIHRPGAAWWLLSAHAAQKLLCVFVSEDNALYLISKVIPSQTMPVTASVLKTKATIYLGYLLFNSGNISLHLSATYLSLHSVGVFRKAQYT